MRHATALDYSVLAEPDLVALARDGDHDAFRAIMTACNQRLFRIARSVVRDEAEAEDVVQEAYVRAFAAIGAFRGEASIATWLTRIVLNEAHGRLRRRRTQVELSEIEAAQAGAGQLLVFPRAPSDPESLAAGAEARRLLERAVDTLPEPFRLVFVLREVEECSVEQTAQALAIPEATVKTRLHRARRLLRARLEAQLADVVKGAWPFLGARCARITEAVLARL